MLPIHFQRKIDDAYFLHFKLMLVLKTFRMLSGVKWICGILHTKILLFLNAYFWIDNLIIKASYHSVHIFNDCLYKMKFQNYWHIIGSAKIVWLSVLNQPEGIGNGNHILRFIFFSMISDNAMFCGLWY